MNTSSGRMHDGLDDKVEILDTQRGYQTGAAATTTSQPIQEDDTVYYSILHRFSVPFYL